MKKNTQAPRYISPLIAMMLFFLLFLCALSSCELQSLTNPQGTTTDSNTVLKPLEVTTTGIENPSLTEATTTQATTAQTTTMPPTTTAAPILYFNPLTGLPCEGAMSSKRPIALSVKEATGEQIGMADIVAEAPTEAAATRLALIGNSHTAILSSVTLASTRPYLAALANDLFAISVYHGTSDTGKLSTSFLYDTIDTKITPIESTSDALMHTIAASGYQQSIAGNIALPYTISGIGETVKPNKLSSTYISVPYSDTAVTTFTYDALAKSYTMRTCTALSGGAALPTFSNILILFHDATLRVTKDGNELTLDTDIGGSGYYISQGGVMPITWRRDTATSRLILADEYNIPLKINRGKTYIGMTTFAYREKLILN